jgi:UDP-GlcNAc:undecaprenyl-phosphate GlcNAc-1-phosphate transferase
MRRVALRLGWVHYPRPISIAAHVDPIPYLGGVSILLAAMITSLLLVSDVSQVAPVALAALCLMVAGIVDDKVALRSGKKLVAQILVTSIVLTAGRSILAVPAIFGDAFLGYVAISIWIVGMINAVNLLDIMDGLAGGVAAIAALAFAGMALLQGDLDVAISAAAVAGGIAGFLVFNFEPASIFMGDAGSQFLGLMLALFPLLLLREPSMAGRSGRLVVASVIVLAVPVFEIVYTPTIRVLTGKSPWRGSKDHFALRAYAMGYSIRRIVLTTYAVGTLFSVLGVLHFHMHWTRNWVTLLVLLSGALFAGVWLSRVRVPRRLPTLREREV